MKFVTFSRIFENDATVGPIMVFFQYKTHISVYIYIYLYDIHMYMISIYIYIYVCICIYCNLLYNICEYLYIT